MGIRGGEVGGALPGRAGTAAPFSPSCASRDQSQGGEEQVLFKSWDPSFSFPSFCFFLLFFCFFWRLLKKEGKREDEQIFVSYFGHFQRYLEAGRGEWDPEPLVLNHQLH